MKKAHASLSELMAAASEVAFYCSDNEEEAYRITQEALIEFIKTLPNDTDFPESTDEPLLSGRFFH